MANIIDEKKISENLVFASRSARKRSIICLHDKNDTLQRMINTVLNGSYLRPHKHENPDKLEIFTILNGKVAILFFDNDGAINESIVLDKKGPIYVVEIPQKTWHTFVVLSKEASLFEIIEGRYDEKTHKSFAPWSPDENDIPAAKKYLAMLKKKAVNKK